ncbi:MAG: chromate transporter [Eubacterium ventriosum]
MVALLESEFIYKKKWIEKDDFLNMIAIAESTPGPMAVNSATYIGYHVAGFYGATAATLAVCIPSFIVIYCISLFFNQFLSLHYITCAFKGIQVCVVYLILTAGIRILKNLERNLFNTLIILIVAIVMVIFPLQQLFINLLYFDLWGVGVIVYFFKKTFSDN